MFPGCSVDATGQTESDDLDGNDFLVFNGFSRSFVMSMTFPRVAHPVSKTAMETAIRVNRLDVFMEEL